MTRCFTRRTPFDFHEHNFSVLAGLLSSFASRVIVSFFDPYAKANRRLKKIGVEAEKAAGSPEQQVDLLGRFSPDRRRQGWKFKAAPKRPRCRRGPGQMRG